MAGIYGALRVLGKDASAIKEQRVVVVGAGSAGMGVVRVIALGASSHQKTLQWERESLVLVRWALPAKEGEEEEELHTFHLMPG